MLTPTYKNPHLFHIPVMGVAFTIDTPIKLAHLGISSVVSMVDDGLLEQLRAHYSKQFNLAYEEISAKVDDFRARRVTAYLNMVKEIVEFKFNKLKESAYEKGTELEKYIQLLPPKSEWKKEFLNRFNMGGMSSDLREWVRKTITPGEIDINIMTKLDRENSKGDIKLPSEFNDAHAALRGFAQSDLESSVVLSAGLNPRLYSYFEQFPDFYPDATGQLKKKIILKISDYRSALIQGKFLAKKGLWVSEFRMESGLNCGGHAFATDGLLMGPILEEFKQQRQELKQSLFELYSAALTEKKIPVPAQPFEQKFTAQGGVGTADEQNQLLDNYGLDSVGWGSPFLLVPEATTVDQHTMDQLCKAQEKDLFLSHASPLGVRFNNMRDTSMSLERERLIDKGRPGSSCPKKFSVLNREFTEEPICTASRQYQKLKIDALEAAQLEPEVFKKEYDKVVARECLCVGLTNSALMNYDIPTKHYKESVSICPGPNMAYYSKVIGLQEMVDHVYGRNNVMQRPDRPHMFLKELDLYLNYYEELLADAAFPYTKQTLNQIAAFEKNLNEGMVYYRHYFSAEGFETERDLLEAANQRFLEISMAVTV